MQILPGNYIDLIIILVLVYFATKAFRHGFFILLADFISFLGSLLLSFRFYKYISEFLKINFSLNHSISDALGFLFTAIILESIFGFILGLLVHKLPKKIIKHKLSNFLGLLVGLGEGLVLISFLLVLIIALPLKPNIKVSIEESQIGGLILEKTATFEKYTDQIFGGVIHDSLTYFTIKPEEGETVNLEVASHELSVDEKSEREMLVKVNEEREKLAIKKLKIDPNLVPIARDYAKDMWERSYFSHYSPEGEDVSDRLGKNSISYLLAGENLALAPTLTTAHIGLMNSEGHRENILNPDYNFVGIGVVDNGIYGKMFVQIFKD